MIVVAIAYDERSGLQARRASRPAGASRFADVLAFENFVLLMVVIFGLQFVDRSFGPVLPLFVGDTRYGRAARGPLAGMLFSIAAGAGGVRQSALRAAAAEGSARGVIATACACGGVGVAGFLLTASAWWLALPTAVFGIAIGAATTAAYTAAATRHPGGRARHRASVC